jgi:menaquinone-dependent protoporphyrinogen IX oxidase
MKGVIIYKGKYGATLQYADWLGTMLDLPVYTAGDERPAELAAADYVIMGSSVYIGKLQLRNWLAAHQSRLLNKKLFFFTVCGTSLQERDKLENFIRTNVPIQIQQHCTFYFLPGRLEFRKLTFTDRLLLKIGARMSRKTGAPAIIKDYDDVKQEHLESIVKAVKDQCIQPKEEIKTTPVTNLNK